MQGQYSAELCHHGILGQKWGVRRFQNSDGSLTSEGLERYGHNARTNKTTRVISKDLRSGEKANKKAYKSELKALKSQKKSKSITKNDYKLAKEKAKDKLIKSDREEQDAALKAFVDTTSRGRNIATGLLQTGFGLTLLSAANSNVSAPYANKLAAGIGGALLTTKGVVNLVNEASATKYRPDKATQKEQTKKAVSEYQKSYNKASNMSDKADDVWRDVKEQYKNLGSNPVSRIKEVSKAQKGKGSEAATKYWNDFEKASNMSDKADDEWRRSKDLYKKTGKTGISRVVNNARYGK